MDEWQINKPLGRCCGTDKKIEQGEEFFAALVETPQGLQRCDFCAEYWHNHKPQVYCFWKSKLINEEQKKHLFVDDDMLMVFFDRLAEETDTEKLNFRFVLALVLMRRRRLKYDSSRTEENREIWRLRKVGEDEYVDVVNPNLGEEQVGELSSQIGQILHAEL